MNTIHEKVFLENERKLKNALSRVKRKLNYFSNNRETLTKKDSECWNDWHDLENRLEDRIFQNWSDYKEWHFEENGFNVY